MTWDLRDGGLANQWWQGYLEPADAAEFAGVARSTMLVAGGLPVHIRVLPRDAAGVIVLAHGLRTYGLVLAALLLRLHRRGFTVVQVDLPGFGQSGGARGQTAAAHVREAIGRAIDFAAERAQSPIHLLGLGEECLAVYEACARPGIASASLHAVYDGTDDALAGTKTGSDGAVVLAPEAAFPAAADGAARRALAEDMLAVRSVPAELLRTLAVPLPGTPHLEASPVPIQIIASERSALLPYETAVHRFTRLRSPKDLVTLPEAFDWSQQPGFLDTYAGNVVRWFTRHAGPPAMATVQEMETQAAAVLAELETVATLPTEPGLAPTAKTKVLSLEPRTPARLRAAGPEQLPPEPFVLPDGPVNIGRASGNSLVLRHGTVSGSHARIRWQRTHYVIVDLASTNGTFVNERKLAGPGDPVQLASGDRLRLGGVAMIFELARMA